MRKDVRFLVISGLALGLAGCGAPKDGAATSSAGASTASAGASADAVVTDAAPAAFGQCRACHSVEPGKHGIGPSLHAVYGTKAGDIPGFAFSPALKGSGLTWDDATLDRWLAGPMKLVPGTKMVYAGMPDAAKRKELVEYIKSLK